MVAPDFRRCFDASSAEPDNDTHHGTSWSNALFHTSQIWELSVQCSRNQWRQPLLCKGHICRESSRRSLFNPSVPHAKHNTANFLRSILSEEHSLRQVIVPYLCLDLQQHQNTIPKPNVPPCSLLLTIPSVLWPFHFWTVKTSTLQDILWVSILSKPSGVLADLVCSAFSRFKRCWNWTTGLFIYLHLWQWHYRMRHDISLTHLNHT